jgi:hypothetical protein
MNRETVEVDVVAKAHKATHNIRQPSWAAHCAALSINLDEAEEEAEKFRTRPTIKIKTPAYDFRPTPLCVVIPPQARAPIPPTPLKVEPVEELDLNWEP